MNTKKLTLALLVLCGSFLVSGSALADTTKGIKNDHYVPCDPYGDFGGDPYPCPCDEDSSSCLPNF